ncbi:TPA: endonuclease [Salmonella enterica subsp. enterica serovar Enteritidis]|uniref:NUMOD4 motif-containing HNH endonuclease n=1 Tax=Salmonella enterica TaxID=28901 RepID=UPI0002A6E3F8|nr:NUMOD4 motif-containing HNH endonuclease [Salmonella enterica]ELO82259.1 phage-related HNH endonuclease [Salmonella enterica subsp. enterica serovar Enteritidis str. SARB17]HAE4697915.1 endonuclease [Salmonella enterica subsp. enterica serovar Enteritidis]HAU6874726.1 endonuclease [Salmonella enterica subsp. enterica serovar Enteritidis]
MNELWRDISGYEGLYQVSSRGAVRSLPRKDAAGHHRKGKTLKNNIGTTGYPQVGLCKNGKLITTCVHRLVAESFLPNPASFNFVNHIDGDKTNNIISNLEWCTQQQNIVHAIRTGLNIAKDGIKSHSFKSPIEATNISTGKTFMLFGTKDIEAHGFNNSSVYKCVNGVISYHRNHCFRRVANV